MTPVNRTTLVAGKASSSGTLTKTDWKLAYEDFL